MGEASIRHRYAIALGSNRRHGHHGPPRRIIAAALDALREAGLTVSTASPVIASAPLGPSARRYANAAAIVECSLTPPALLVLLKQIEVAFGRRPGQRWGSRVLDLDIILWCGGTWNSAALTVPHRQWRHRFFVADPLAAIAADWRDPVTRLSVRQTSRRLRRARPVDPARSTA